MVKFKGNGVSGSEGRVRDRAPARNRIFDLIRLALAVMVLEQHSFDLSGHWSREPFRLLMHTDIGPGSIAVYCFFLLSGYLVAGSWVHDPRLGPFLLKRTLRIVPGYVVAVTLSVLAAGLLAPGIPHVFRELVHAPWRSQFVFSLLRMGSPQTPPFFPGLPSGSSNGSVWTVGYEARCYLLLAVLGVLGCLRHRLAWLVLTAALAIEAERPGSIVAHFYFLWKLGIEPVETFRFTFSFFVGGCYFLFRDAIRFSVWVSVMVSLIVIALCGLRVYSLDAFILGGSYLLFGLGALKLSNAAWHFPDISYGVYLYGYPVQQLCVWYIRPGPWGLFGLSLAGALGMGILSWYLVERPALRLKRRSP